MENKIKPQINDIIADTLFVTLSFKAHDAMSDNPILNDRKSLELFRSLDYDYAKFGLGKLSFVGTCCRSKYFDDEIRKFIENNANPVVILLGCGLDTRYERLGECSERAHFVLVDFPEVMALRRRLFPERTNESLYDMSLYDKGWMEACAEKHGGQCIIVVEGVLMYLHEEDLRPFFDDLSRYFPGAELHFDCMSAFALKHSKKHDVIRRIEADFHFGEEPNFLEKWYDGRYILRETNYYTDMKRPSLIGWRMAILTRLPKIRRASYMVKYQITGN